jgi:hypothetical protein
MPNLSLINVKSGNASYHHYLQKIKGNSIKKIVSNQIICKTCESTTKVQGTDAISMATNSTTLNVNKTLQIQNGDTTAPTSFISLDTSLDLLRLNLCQNGTTANYGSSGNVLTSGGVNGTLTWEPITEITQSGETTEIITLIGTITYDASFTTKPKIFLTLNLNGGGTTIIPIAVANHTVVSSNYTGFTWIAGTTSTTATISWYATL